ncbi:MAG TPA: hypothetical protein VNO70_01555 [Blastocatellia bacterium]|nr:hypothetical protein [Blastocatellia bacterium]
MLALAFIIAASARTGGMSSGLAQDKKPARHADAGKAANTPDSEKLAKETFERLKKFNGKWVGSSAKGR